MAEIFRKLNQDKTEILAIGHEAKTEKHTITITGHVAEAIGSSKKIWVLS